ncbi:hypothetical protein FHW58_001076 [Duganella sp. 1224]|uniref:hypothetical protein n=1 Tax=Duganella sp. 1224 TaxID=2587052 RepID=UPI0015CA7AF3|nr:hypothetical protein [Duganella sp. 1224]NYE59924.1 hypothetical protein [Duganella sp. 1224]
MRRLAPLALAFSLSLLVPAAVLNAAPASANPGLFVWKTTRLAPTITREEAEAIASRYLKQDIKPDEAQFVSITYSERRDNVERTFFHGWRLYYAKAVSPTATGGQPGTTLLVNGIPAVSGGFATSAPLWNAKSVVADIPGPAR